MAASVEKRRRANRHSFKLSNGFNLITTMTVRARNTVLTLLAMIGAVLVDQVASQAQISNSTHWCASPRRNEPLMREAVGLATSNKSVWGQMRGEYGMTRVPRTSVVLIRDEAVCRHAAMLYATQREWGEDPLETPRIVPVLVIQVGSRYLVDDLRSRRVNWEVHVYDMTWQSIGPSYGGGS